MVTIIHICLGIILVYTDTDTVSVRLPYWHSTGTDSTQTSYFMSTTTLRDTHSNMEILTGKVVFSLCGIFSGVKRVQKSTIQFGKISI